MTLTPHIELNPKSQQKNNISKRPHRICAFKKSVQRPKKKPRFAFILVLIHFNRSFIEMNYVCALCAYRKIVKWKSTAKIKQNPKIGWVFSHFNDNPWNINFFFHKYETSQAAINSFSFYFLWNIFVHHSVIILM